MANRLLYYVFSCILSLVVLIFVMKFLGITPNDVRDFVVNGIGAGIKFLMQFRGIFHW